MSLKNKINIEKTEEKDYNILPYYQALKIDKRNIFVIYLNLVKMKFEIISILFYPEEFTHKSLELSVFILDCLFSFFINALLYTDDIASEKYHNNGKLNFITSIILSLSSNVVSYIIIFSIFYCFFIIFTFIIISFSFFCFSFPFFTSQKIFSQIIFIF